MREKLPVLKILLAGFGWGIIGVFSRPLSEAGLSAVQITAIRSVIVAAGMAGYLFFVDRPQLRIRVRDLWMFLGSGLLSIVFFNICYFLTIQRATLAAASILLYTAPCFVLLMSAVFFREKITLQKVAALVLAFGGCGLVSGIFAGGLGPGSGGAAAAGSVLRGSAAVGAGGTGMSLTAILTGIGSGLGYALYSIFGSVALKKYRPFTVIFYTFLIASAGLVPFSHPGQILAVLGSDGRMAACALALGIISTFLPFVFYTSGLEQMEAGKASVLAFAEPLVATLAGIAVFGESLTAQNAVGIGLIFGAILLLNIPISRGRGRSISDIS